MRYHVITKKNRHGFPLYYSAGQQWLSTRDLAYSYPTEGMARRAADDLNKADPKLKAYVVPAYEAVDESNDEE